MAWRSNQDNFGNYYAVKHKSTYGVWKNMIQRCTNKNNPAYHNYGARGITVCVRWYKFENFLADMGERPDNLTLDRIDNNLGYYKKNCRWADDTTQARNSRKATHVTIDGETMCIAEWLERCGTSYTTYKKRRSKYGWSMEKALTTPTRKWVRKT